MDVTAYFYGRVIARISNVGRERDALGLWRHRQPIDCKSSRIRACWKEPPPHEIKGKLDLRTIWGPTDVIRPRQPFFRLRRHKSRIDPMAAEHSGTFIFINVVPKKVNKRPVSFRELKDETFDIEKGEYPKKRRDELLGPKALKGYLN